MRALLLAARVVVRAHPWVAEALQAQATPTGAALAHFDRGLDCLARGGCSLALRHHALHLLGSRVLGFSQDLFDDSAPTANPDPALLATLQSWAERYPRVVELGAAVSHSGPLGGCDDDAEFEFALDVILDGIERQRVAEQALARH